MNKDALLAAYCAATKLPRRRAEQAIGAIFTTLSQSLARGERVEIRNFGAFGVRASEPHTGKHPRTGERTHVEAQRCVLFRPGKALRAALQGPESCAPKKP